MIGSVLVRKLPEEKHRRMQKTDNQCLKKKENNAMIKERYCVKTTHTKRKKL